MASEETAARRQGLNLRDAVVFLLDYRLSMTTPDAGIAMAPELLPPSGTPSLLSVTLRCIADVLKAKIVARSPDVVAVLAFGTRGRARWPRVRVLRPLARPDAAAVRRLQRAAARLEAGDADPLRALDPHALLRLPVPDEDLDFCFGPDGPLELDKALWAARHQLTAMAASARNVLHRKRVFLFTNDGDPSGANPAVKQLCLTQAKDLADLGATLDVSLLTSPGAMADSAASDAAPDAAAFFDELVYTDDVGTEAVRGSVTIATIYSFDDLLSRVRKKQMTKRAIRKTTLILGDDYRIGVALYALVKKASRPAKVELAAATNKPVLKITSATCEQSGEIVKPAGVRHTFTPDFLKNTRYKVPGLQDSKDISETAALEAPTKTVFGFKKSELVKAKALGKVGILMYGFRKMTAIRREYILGAPTFVYPDDTDYEGSTKAFACLLECMLEKDVAGIASVRLTDKSPTGMRFAALVPQKEKYSDDLEKSIPGGLHLFYLPFKDDIYTAWRKELKKEEKKEKEEVKEEVDVEVKEEEEEVVVKKEETETVELLHESESVSVARRMVRNMKIKEYSPRLFLNPDLQRFYAGLENAAGVESLFNPQDDLLNPDVALLQERGGHLAQELKRLEVGEDFDGEALAEQFGTKGAKRAAEQSEAALKKKAAKRAAMEEAARECDDEIYVLSVRHGTLGKMLKAELQVYCRAHGLNDKGNKANLVVRVEDDVKERLGPEKR